MKKISQILCAITVLLTSCTVEDGVDGKDGNSIGVSISLNANGCNDLIFFIDINGNNFQDTGETTIKNIQICNGINGINGINGVNGADGEDGEDGEDGTSVSFFITQALNIDCEYGGLIITVFNDLNGDGIYNSESESIVNQTLACYPERVLNISTEGLLAYYPFSGNADDVSGNNKNGQVNGATLTTDRFGRENRAYNFTSNQDIIVPNTQTYGNVFPLTISLWYTATDLKKGELVNIFSKYFSNSWNGYQIKLGDYSSVSNRGSTVNNGFGVTSWYVKGLNNTVIGYYNRPPFLQEFIEKDVWYHYVFVVDESGGKIYVNGNLIDSQEWAGPPGQVSNSFLWKIGGNYLPGQPGWFFNGKIDDISIWKRALNAYEVKRLYSND